MGGQVITTTQDTNFTNNSGGLGVSNGSGGCKARHSGKEIIRIKGWSP